MYIGIDLGTSSVKLLLMDKGGKILKTASRKYPLFFPHPGWSEQNPEDWMTGIEDALSELLTDFEPDCISAIGVSGQMHGLVAVDRDGNVIRPAILWNDGRTSKETDWLNTGIGKDILSSCTGNIAFAGFTAPKLLWMKNNEPALFSRIHKILLPKDYVVYRLTGLFCTDVSDASGTLLYDVKNRCWSAKMLDICGIKPEQMPKVFESYESVGHLSDSAARRLRLNPQTIVAAGAADNAAAAPGTGTVGDGKCNISLGTSGTILISSSSFQADRFNALHSFAHSDGTYYLMGCMLSAAACDKWWEKDIIEADSFYAEQSKISEDSLGHNNVFFLPYLMGERSPINDTNARATFIGMTMDTTRADLTQAVLEGVAFGIRDNLEVAGSLGMHISESTICGGGASSALWKKIIANVLGITLRSIDTEEGPASARFPPIPAVLPIQYYFAFQPARHKN